MLWKKTHIQSALMFGGLFFGQGKLMAVSYDSDAKSIIDNRCAGVCHNSSTHFGGVNLSQYSISLNGKSLKESWRLVMRVIDAKRMPPPAGDPLTEADVAILKSWEKSEFPRAESDNGRMTFDTTPLSIKMTPYVVRRARIKQILDVAGETNQDGILAGFDNLKDIVGSHNYASGVVENLSYSPEKTAFWLVLTKKVCESPALKKTFSTPQGEDRLIGLVTGQAPTDLDRKLISDIAKSTNEATRFESICLAYLNSLEVLGI